MIFYIYMYDFIHVHVSYIIHISSGYICIHTYMFKSMPQLQGILGTALFYLLLLLTSMRISQSLFDFPLGLLPFRTPVPWIALCSSTCVSSGAQVQGDNLVSLMTQSSNYAQNPRSPLCEPSHVSGILEVYMSTKSWRPHSLNLATEPTTDSYRRDALILWVWPLHLQQTAIGVHFVISHLNLSSLQRTSQKTAPSTSPCV